MTDASDYQAQLAVYQEQLNKVLEALEVDPTNETLIELKQTLTEGVEATSDYLKIQQEASIAVKDPAVLKAEKEAQYAHLKKPQFVFGDKFRVGGMCQARYTLDGKWYFATITDFNPQKNQCSVQFCGYGSTQDKVEEANVRLCHPHPPERSLLHEDVECKCLYSVDGKWYNARLDYLTAWGTFWVIFTDYGNTEEVDIHQIQLKTAEEQQQSAGQKRTLEKANLEAKLEALKQKAVQTPEERDAKRKKIHAMKSQMRFKKIEEERNEKQTNWQSFMAKDSKKKKKGSVSGMMKKKGSIFQSPDSVTGKVGVVGSGKGTTEFVNTRIKHKKETLSKVED
eukprot:GFYU01011424.1.p1 GENE.GFYU01011424.1~~GFYU01011424.1.p1  ORF type:complete len:339 (-),score=93.91 GFYU01011424.1:41-1057(-)